MTLDIIAVPDLPLRHGFFTRRGGASSGIFAGLNCGPGSSDLSDAVAINRARAAEALGLAPDRLVTVNQVHSGDAVVVATPPAERPSADGMATATPGLALAVLTADCAPILFADPEAGVAGAAHAGWRGARDGVIEATLSAMERLGADRARVVAVIGPTISQAAYEVGQDFRESFCDDDPANARFFAGGPNGRPHFDLPGFCLARLRAAGVSQAAWTGHCTYGDAERFYSYRRATHRGEADYGRLISAIRL
ncbi:MAG TPA: peptidoglycan editing factor PgeF [Paracoccaceae bacterium]|nr:peptidoglycan editing factor PgeF [Paracoccaceae bacterium]